MYLDMPYRAATLYDSMAPPRGTAPARQVAKDFVELVGPSEFSDWSSWSFQESPCRRRLGWVEKSLASLEAASDLLEIVKDIQQASKLYQENQESTRASSIAEAEQTIPNRNED